MVVFERDIAVDMGTTTTLLFEEGKGIVAREPTVLAVDRVRGEIKKVGTDAQKVLSAAAWTYVLAALGSLLSFLRFFLLVNGNRRRD